MAEGMVLSDIELVTRIRARDMAAFDVLFRRYYQPLLVYVARRAVGRDVAEDVVQEIFLHVWMSPPVDVSEAGIRAYLYAAARNRLINQIRDSATRERAIAVYGEVDAVAEPSAEDDPLQVLEREELQRVLAAAVEALPVRAREVWELYREHQLSYAEIAAVMGVSVNTVKTQLRRTLGVLRAVVRPFLVVLLALHL